MDTINRVWHGEAGLARTYWLFGIIAGALFGIPFRMVEPGSSGAMLVGILFAAYLAWVNTGIWRAASKYEGPAIWSGLAKAASALGFLMLAVFVLSVGLALVSDPQKAQSPEQGPWLEYQQQR